MKHTKIVATISDRRCEVEFIKSLYEAGMNVIRMNTAHLGYEGLSKIINNTRAVSDKIAILMDTKGPEIRTAENVNDETFNIKTGQIIKIEGDESRSQENTPEQIFLSYAHIAADMKVGGSILFDDGEIEVKVLSIEDGVLTCEALNDGELGSRKSVNLPGVRVNLPSLTEKDRINIGHGIELNVDFIAHSFVRSAADVKEIQDILDKHNSPAKIIAKIENQEGVDNIDEILEVVYGVMVARGDLAIEVGQEKIPGIQRQLIKKSVEAKKAVIVATQMLHTMIKNPRPTRAEVTDVANAIFYRTDALMLSGETAYGDYPLESVQTMSRIAEEAENTKMSSNDISVPTSDDDKDMTAFLSKQAVKAYSRIGTKAIFVDGITGGTACNVAAFRGPNPVFAQCFREETVRHLALSYGVFPQFITKLEELTEDVCRKSLRETVGKLIEEEVITSKDLMAYLGGSFGITRNNITPGASFLEFFTAEELG
jgi:pyruvate kinase